MSTSCRPFFLSRCTTFENMETNAFNKFLRLLLGCFNRWVVRVIVKLCSNAIQHYLPLIRSEIVVSLYTIYNKPTILRVPLYKIVYRRKFALFPGRPGLSVYSSCLQQTYCKVRLTSSCQLLTKFCIKR